MRTPEPENKDVEAPERLVAALRQTQKNRVFVSRELDASILGRAKANIAQRIAGRRRKQLLQWWSAAAAAAVVLAGWLAVGRGSANPQDVNRDGRVDVRDALVLAKRTASGRVRGTKWDFNHDGVVDKKDAEVIAAHAVKLNKRGAS